MPAIFSLRNEELVEMKERPFATEAELQRHLAAHPELLSAQAPEGERRRWLLIEREMGVPDAAGPDRWSLDHLFVDQDATPTLVEVKRSSDTRLRREVVGQMLDYAANAPKYWNSEVLRGRFEGNFPDEDAAMTALTSFLEDEVSPVEFWDAVAANLQERRLRLIFVADRCPSELRSIVEFLNEQLELTEVLAVEIRQYADSATGHVALAPEIIGSTEMARRVKRPGTSKPRPRGTEEAFYEQTRKAYPPEVAARILRVFEHAKAIGSRQKFGRGDPFITSAWLGETGDDKTENPMLLLFGGDGSGISVSMKHFWERRTPNEMQRLVDLLRGLRGTSEAVSSAVEKEYKTFCTLRAEDVLATDEDAEKFLRFLDEASVRA